MSAQPTLTTARLVLRPFIAADAPALQRLAGDVRVADTTLTIPHPYPDGMAETWIATHEPGYADGKLAAFAITEASAGLVGGLGLRLEVAHHRAELGYWIAVPHWGKGYATEAAGAAVAWGFEVLGVNRIQATHMTRNPASGRVMEKAGMRFEGCHRQYYYKSGQFEDVMQYAILAEEYRGGRGLT